MAVDYEYDVGKFQVSCGAMDFSKQYNSIYTKRLQAAKPVLLKRASERWPAHQYHSLAEMPKNTLVVIIGNIYKEMKLKPSILKEIATKDLEEDEDNITKDNFLSQDDILYLEDEVQRIILEFNDKELSQKYSKLLITGIVCALLGEENESNFGQFKVKEISFCEPRPVKPIVALPAGDQSCWIGFVAGLEFSPSQMQPKHARAVQLLAEFLRHHNALQRLVIVGNSIRVESHASDEARYISRKFEALTIKSMNMFDEWLASLPLGEGIPPSGGLAVDILPGEQDCVSQLFPQQPIHSTTLLKATSRAASSKVLKSVTNPASLTICNRKCIINAGQAIGDIVKYTSFRDPLDVMDALLHWGHLAPTCPDTLLGYPMSDKDQLVLPHYPDIFVTGNVGFCSEPCWRRGSLSNWDPSTSSGSDSGALLIALPAFSQCFSIILVNPLTLETKLAKFE